MWRRKGWALNKRPEIQKKKNQIPGKGKETDQILNKNEFEFK